MGKPPGNSRCLVLICPWAPFGLQKDPVSLISDLNQINCQSCWYWLNTEKTKVVIQPLKLQNDSKPGDHQEHQHPHGT